jgi:hypothetical protein
MKKPKPLAKIGKVEIHRSKFHAFETVKYLDIAALKKASKARIEIGRVEGGGTEATIVAEVSKGMITKLTPNACEGCAKPASAAARKVSAAKKKERRAVLVRTRELGLLGTKLPIPVKSTRAFTDLEIGPIIIRYWPPDLCIIVEYTDGEICEYCVWGLGACISNIFVP